MLAVRLPEQLDNRLSDLSHQTNRSKSFYVKKALQDYLDDHEDHLLALARLEKKNTRITIEEMEGRLGLED
jgi:RHH-type rel operon transcriptional repressor/antitoxin RelB